MSAEGFGAHTGEYTADMLKSCHVDGAIVGHGERRARFGDEDAVVASKVDALIAADLLVGILLRRDLARAGRRSEESVVLQQLQASVLRLPVDQVKHVIVAYEPVWAIGTGVTASAEQAQAMHRCIRGWLAEAFGEEAAAGHPFALRRVLQARKCRCCFLRMTLTVLVEVLHSHPKIFRGH